MFVQIYGSTGQIPLKRGRRARCPWMRCAIPVPVAATGFTQILLMPVLITLMPLALRYQRWLSNFNLSQTICRACRVEGRCTAVGRRP